MLQRIEGSTGWQAPTNVKWVIIFLGFIVIQIPAIINFYHNDGSDNTYLLFAQALLKGDLFLPLSGPQGDLAFFNNHWYMPYPPLPGLILLPLVAIFGAAHVNTVAVATLIACGSLYLLHQTFTRLKVPAEYYAWLTLAFVFGTGYWYALITSHHVYAFAQITSVVFQLLVINEVLKAKRWWLVGTYIGLAFLCRQFTIFYAVFAAGYLLHLHKAGKQQSVIKSFLQLCAPIVLLVLAYLYYNYLRFGNFFDTGYQHILFIGILKERVEHYGVFSTHYFLYNFYTFFLKGFNIEFQGATYLKIKDVDLWGTSLLAASPFLIASLKARWLKLPKMAAWLSVSIIITGQLFYHNNGWHQVNTSRFSLDFLPLLLLLTGLGITCLPKWLVKGMILYAILLNVISFIIHSIYQ